MGILRRLREWREDKDGTLIGPNIDAGSVNTDDQTINESVTYPDGTTVTTSPSGEGGDLSGAGFETGDVLILASMPMFTTDKESVSTTEYTATQPLGEMFGMNWEALFGGVDTVIGTTFRSEPGTDETLDMRWQNVTDGETLVEVTGLESVAPQWSGWTAYTPTTTNSELEIRFEQRTNPGNNTSGIRRPALYIGVEL